MKRERVRERVRERWSLYNQTILTWKQLSNTAAGNGIKWLNKLLKDERGYMVKDKLLTEYRLLS